MFSKNKKEGQEAELELAKAMNHLAERLERFQDPLWWQKTIGSTFQTMMHIPALQPTIAQALPAGVTIESVTVTLSGEEREKMSQKIYGALQPQIQEFDGFVKASLAELPPHRLKELAEKIEGGAKPEIQRRRGCIYIALEDGTEAHLGL